jgi:outer membrane protein assembly factor BamD (BamD/ComL family)
MVLMKIIFPIFFCIVVLLACASTNTAIPPDITPSELVQRAQEESDRNRYEAAFRYYNAILERFPDDRTAVCGAQYEIAFIHYKQKRYVESEGEFAALLDSYDGPDGALLPQKYFILSNIVLESIKKAETKSKRLRLFGK